MLALTTLSLLLMAAEPDARCEFDIESNFDAAPATLFPYLSHGDKIRWLGPFKIVEEGDPEPFGLGSVREVRLFGVIVREKVTRYDPPNTLDYAVIEGRAYRQHRATMRLVETPHGGSRLHWTVEFESSKSNPQRHCRFVQRYLNRRLKKLHRRVEKDQRT